MASKPFSKAAKLFKKRNYEQVIRLLEPQVFRFRESYSFYYLLGFSCLHMGDYGSAYTYLKRGHDLKPSNIDTLLGLAAVHLKRQETAQALEYWLEVLDQDPKNQFALRGMKLLKKNSEPEYLVDFADSGKIERLIPQPSGRYTGKIFLVIIILALLALTSLLYFKVINTEARKNVRLADDFPALFIDDVSSVLEGAESDHPFSISEGEMKKAFHALEKTMLRRLVYPSKTVEIPASPSLKRKPRLHVLDTGLINHARGLMGDLVFNENIGDTHRGIIAEHITGQELLASNFLISNKLNFWVRDKKESNAEIDYIIHWKGKLIPIEVKSGSIGKLKSLHQFMDRAPHNIAVRVYQGEYLVQKAKTIAGKTFTLLNLPFYLVHRIEQELEKLR